MTTRSPSFPHILNFCLTLASRRVAAPSAQIGIVLVGIDHSLESGVETQNAGGAAAEIVDEVEQVPPELLLEAADPSLHTAVEVANLARGLVEDFTGQHCVALGFEANHQERREGVGELQDATGADEDDPCVDLGHRGGDDPSEHPVDGHEGDPDPLAGLGFEEREVKKVTSEVVVENFDADVTVQHGGDDARDESDDIACGLPAVGRDSLVGDVVDILALHAVAVDAVDHVAGVDEDVGTEEALPEIHRAAHLRHQFHKQSGSAEAEDGVHEAVDIVGDV